MVHECSPSIAFQSAKYIRTQVQFVADVASVSGYCYIYIYVLVNNI